MDPPDPIEAIKFRMEQQGLTRKDLEPIIGTRTRVAEVLNRERGLSIEMIRRLHDRLGISADVLIRPCSKSDPLSRRKSDPPGVILFNLPFSAASGGARYLFWLLSIIGVPVTVSELWPAVLRQAPASLAAACRDTCW